MTKPEFVETRMRQVKSLAKKPIHKFNSGMGATLCWWCSKIITTGFTEALFCEKCKKEMKNI